MMALMVLTVLIMRVGIAKSDVRDGDDKCHGELWQQTHDDSNSMRQNRYCFSTEFGTNQQSCMSRRSPEPWRCKAKTSAPAGRPPGPGRRRAQAVRGCHKPPLHPLAGRTRPREQRIRLSRPSEDLQSHRRRYPEGSRGLTSTHRPRSACLTQTLGR